METVHEYVENAKEEIYNSSLTYRHYIDPFFVFLWRQSWWLIPVVICIYLNLFLAYRAKVHSHRKTALFNLVLLYITNILTFVWVGRQWWQYSKGLSHLDEEYPSTVSWQRTTCFYADPVLILTLSLAFLGCMLSSSKEKQRHARRARLENRRNGRADAALAKKYTSPRLYLWLVHVLLLVAWFLTTPSLQTKLPSASFLYMDGIENFPPTNYEMGLSKLASMHLYFRMAGWFFYIAAAACCLRSLDGTWQEWKEGKAVEEQRMRVRVEEIEDDIEMQAVRRGPAEVPAGRQTANAEAAGEQLPAYSVVVLPQPRRPEVAVAR